MQGGGQKRVGGGKNEWWWCKQAIALHLNNVKLVILEI